MSRVSFKTRRGRTVTFQARASGPSRSGRATAYTRFVKANIKRHMKSCSPTTAMKKVAADWNKRKK